ncbi:hypothetical protein FACS189456_7590 [Bacteroidia bacterium]|nr:hypothetical protein FACS189456_7590 [Bacteroidia bacterium]
MAYKEMTLKEKLAIRVRSIELEESGQLEEAKRVWNLVPLSPHMAKFCKEKMGVDFLIQQGYNLSKAEAEYGKDWLTK